MHFFRTDRVHYFLPLLLNTFLATELVALQPPVPSLSVGRERHCLDLSPFSFIKHPSDCLTITKSLRHLPNAADLALYSHEPYGGKCEVVPLTYTFGTCAITLDIDNVPARLTDITSMLAVGGEVEKVYDSCATSLTGIGGIGYVGLAGLLSVLMTDRKNSKCPATMNETLASEGCVQITSKDGKLFADRI